MLIQCIRTRDQKAQKIEGRKNYYPGRPQLLQTAALGHSLAK
jgi:hypothetical protein